MVYTRGQTSSTVSTAYTLLGLRNSTLLLRSVKTAGPSDKQFWASWNNWYHAFLTEAAEAFPTLPRSGHRAEATARWVTFTAKKLRCDESFVRSWLRTADQDDLLVGSSGYA